MTDYQLEIKIYIKYIYNMDLCFYMYLAVRFMCDVNFG